MNLFVFHPHPAVCARWLCDIHVVSQTKETAQIASTVVHKLGGDVTGLYAPTHQDHPCVVWAAAHPGNMWWTLQLGDCLGFEFAFRTAKDHASSEVLVRCRRAFSALGLRTRGMTPWAQAMPDIYRRPVGDEGLSESHPTIQAYRDYYRCAKRWLKGKPVKWSGREPPPWFHEPEGEEILNADDIFSSAESDW